MIYFDWESIEYFGFFRVKDDKEDDNKDSKSAETQAQDILAMIRSRQK